MPEAAATFAVGEGLVGQCAHERKPVRVTNLPADYFRIVSAVGTGTPVQVVASPLLSKSTLLGVVEVATFHQFSSRRDSSPRGIDAVGGNEPRRAAA